MALVLSDIPTFHELWDGVAVFVPPGEDAAWIHALEAALDQPATGAQQRAARYTVGAMVQGTAALLCPYRGLMRFVYLTHSLESCWNHGNAHFLRGVLRELAAAGHEAIAIEPVEAWSRDNLVADAGPAALDGWRAHYPGLTGMRSDAPEALLDGADVVIVHEWTAPAMVARFGGAAPGRGAVAAAVPRHPPPRRQ